MPGGRSARKRWPIRCAANSSWLGESGGGTGSRGRIGRRRNLDLLKRDFTAPAPNCRWVGDMTEIPTDHGKLYLATVIDLYSRRLLGAATGLHPDAQLACDAIKMAVTVRGGKRVIWRDDESQRVIFHSDRGSTYTAKSFMKLCHKLGIRQSMGRVGSCFDNAAAEPSLQQAWNGKSCPATTSPTPTPPKPSCSNGAGTSTTTPAGTAALA